MPRSTSSSTARSSHDHSACIRQALRNAESVCAEHHARLTPLRRRVLELIWHSHQPVLAYELLDRLRSERARAAPPTVYRALDFLMAQGLVHRIESLNAFIGCSMPGHEHSGQFLICDRCRTVAELDDRDIGALISRRARDSGYEVARQTVEVIGRCKACSAPTTDGGRGR